MRIPQFRFYVPLLIAAAAVLGTACDALGFRDTDYRPVIDPANFQAGVDHPYLPLVPGTTYRYSEESDGETAEVVVTVMSEGKVVMGVTCVVVRDTVTEDGVMTEETYDWYAQDRQGNVWYMGEDTKEFGPGGRVDPEGSWEGGVDGALPGIMMPAHPAPGDPYRQEYYLGHAEDMGQVVAIGETVKVPYGTFEDCVKTKDWSMLESGHEFKWYARGVGQIRAEAGADDFEVLVSVERR
ncbi:MAG TPA: hypothetical protein VGC54_02505 [Planctomycetota bacterium]